MALNTAHANNGVLLHAGESILLFCDNVTMSFSGPRNVNAFNGGDKQGRLYLTTHRMIFNNKKQGDPLMSFSFPFIALREVELEQPVFGANYIKGKVIAQPNGNWEGEAKFKLHFKSGGAIDFGTAMLRAAQMASRNYVQDAPPPYTPPSGPWYAAPPPAYSANPNGYMGWVPPTNVFPDQPPPNSVYMTDAPPPYPGINGYKIWIKLFFCSSIDSLKTMALPIFAHWRVRGLSQPVRLLLAYTDTEHVEKFYEMGPAPDFDKSDFHKVKDSIGLDFPNLPYYIDGDYKITESNAILRYIGRKHDLVGKTEMERVRLDMMENMSLSFYMEFAKIAYSPDFESLKGDYIKGLPGKLKSYSDFLGTRKFFASDDVTIVDFRLYELMKVLTIFSPESFEKFQNLLDFVQRFEDLPKIKTYMQSSRFINRPLFTYIAHWGKE